jgi:hypothetical protein
MYVKPAAGLRVIDPVRKQFMPDDGMEVSEFDLYWARRLRDGDVVLAAPDPSIPSSPSSAKPANSVTSKGAK